jgi:hypothetical protein
VDKIVDCIDHLLFAMFVVLSPGVLDLFARMQFEMREDLLGMVEVDEGVLFGGDQDGAASDRVDVLFEFEFFYFEFGPFLY